MKEAQPLSPPSSCHPRPEPTRAQGKGLQRNNDAAQRLCFLHNASLRDSIAGAGFLLCNATGKGWREGITYARTAQTLNPNRGVTLSTQPLSS